MKGVITTILIFISFNGVAQNLTEKEYAVIIIDIERNDDLHPRDIFYWIAQSQEVNKNYEFDFYPIFLKLFYSSSSYDDCCLGKDSRFYTFDEHSKFEFSDEFGEKQKVFREFLQKNSKVIQIIKKQNKWNKLLNEKVTISATAIKATLCNCNIKEDRHFESIFLPISDFKLNSKFWGSENAFYLTDRDYSGFRADY